MSAWRCRSWRASLVDDAAGTLDDAGRAALAIHLGTCADCRGLAVDLRRVPAELAAGVEPSPADAFFVRQKDAIMRRVRHTATVPPRPAFAWRWALSPALAGATALLALALWRPAPVVLPSAVDALDGDALLALSDVTRGVATDGALVGEAAFDESHPGDLLHELPDEDLAALDDLIGDGTGGGI